MNQALNCSKNIRKHDLDLVNQIYINRNLKAKKYVFLCSIKLYMNNLKVINKRGV